MIAQDVYEPLSRYRDEFRGKFADAAAREFDGLTRKSGVDAEANRKLVGEIRRVADELASAKKRRAWRCFFVVVLGLAAAACIVLGGMAAFGGDFNAQATAIAAGTLVGVAALLVKLAIPAYKKCAEEVRQKETDLALKTDEAWRQLEPLNQLYEWDAVQRLIEKVVPRIKFDPYFTERRLVQLHRQFGWDDDFNNGKSVIFSQSGEINGNPFVFGDTLGMSWGSRTYTGTRTVYWTELERDSEGKLRQVTKSETLVAEVTKPCPVYSRETFLLYGNDAAPTLTFSRGPSELSKGDGGFFAKQALKHEIKKLEKFSRNLDDASNYTIMANREFEALFHAVNRNDEQQFRLLFTPLAQTQMLDLLRDKTVGYGDDFSFVKSRKLNLLQSAHLANFSLDTNPEKFANYDLDTARQNFIAFACEYFRETYFSLAPLLAIPLYQQTRTHEDIYGLQDGESSFWEHESIANYIGEKRFKHPESSTENILKTRVSSRGNGFTDLSVTAYSHKTVDRVETVRKMARNGRIYNIDVKWVEYIPVNRTSQVRLAERNGLSLQEYRNCANSPADEWRRFFQSLGTQPERAHYRREIITD